MGDISLSLIPPVMALVGLLVLSFAKPKLGLNLCVLFLPLYWVPESFQEFLAGLMTSSQIPIFADALVIATLCGMVFMRRRSIDRRRMPITFALVIFIVISGLSMINSPDWSRSIGNFGSYVQLAMMTAVLEYVPESQDDLLRLLRFWLISLMVVLAGGLFGAYSGFAGLDNFSVMASGQVRSTFRFPNQLSLYLVVTIPILSAFLVARRGSGLVQRALYVAIPVAIAVLIYSGSRSGLVAGLTAGALLIAVNGPRRLLYILPALILGAGVLWLTTSYLGGEAWDGIRERYDFFSEVFASKDTSEFDFYSTTNRVAWQAFAAHPIVGGGVGAVLDMELSSEQPYEIHNTYLGILGQTGALGFLAFAAIVGLAGRNLFVARERARSVFLRSLADGCAAAVVACGVHAYGNFDWRLRHLWLILAVTSVIRLAAEEERSVAATATEPARTPFRPRLVRPAAAPCL